MQNNDVARSDDTKHVHNDTQHIRIFYFPLRLIPMLLVQTNMFWTFLLIQAPYSSCGCCPMVEGHTYGFLGYGMHFRIAL